MTDAPTANLRPATAEETAESLSFALRYNGRKRVHDADDAIGRITVVRHLEASGFVVMKKPPAPSPTTTNMLSSAR